VLGAAAADGKAAQLRLTVLLPLALAVLSALARGRQHVAHQIRARERLGQGAHALPFMPRHDGRSPGGWGQRALPLLLLLLIAALG